MKKSNWKEFEKTLKKNNIKELYHFTDKNNIESIISNGGLYSWKSCLENGINISNAGGSNLSHDLDRKIGIEDYIHLSFVPQHPMLYDTIEDKRIANPILLIIDIEVIYNSQTIFSDRNAIKKNAKIGDKLEDFEHIDFEIIKKNNYFELEDEEQPFYQAEVMVKEFIPIQYILNIKNLETDENQIRLTSTKLIYKLPDCKNLKFELINDFLRKQENGLGQPMRKLRPYETYDLQDPTIIIFIILSVENITNPFAIQLAKLNACEGFNKVIDIEDDTFSFKDGAVLSSINGKLSFSLM